jgi:hypothetical protein
MIDGGVSIMLAMAALSAATTAYSMDASNDAADEQQRVQAANEARKKDMSQRRQAREMRIKQARMQQMAYNMGVGESSGAQSASSSLFQQQALNLGDVNSMEFASAKSADIQKDLFGKQQMAQWINTAGQLGGAAYSYGMFNSPSATPSAPKTYGIGEMPDRIKQYGQGYSLFN